MAAAYGASLGGGGLSKSTSGRARRCWARPVSRSLTAERNVAAASISARLGGPVAGLMIRACEMGAELSCHAPVRLPCPRRADPVGRAGREPDQQRGAALGAGPLAAA